MNKGKIIAIRGVVVDVEFPIDQTPKVYDALTVDNEKTGKLILEVEAIMSPGKVRTVAMGNTFGLPRGIEVLNTGKPISVPVGEETAGR